MIDYQELKRLAEAATPAPWQDDKGAVHAPESGKWPVDGYAASSQEDSAFIAAANPAAVLALLSDLDEARNGMKFQPALRLKNEIDQLKAEVESLRKDLESHKRMLLGAACSLGAIGEALGAEMGDDAGELEGIAVELRKDAERYRWTATEGNWVARFHGKWRAHIGDYGDAAPTSWYPTRGEAIDAAISAMSKESGQ